MCAGTMGGKLKQSWERKNPTEPFPFIRSEEYNAKNVKKKKINSQAKLKQNSTTGVAEQGSNKLGG